MSHTNPKRQRGDRPPEYALGHRVNPRDGRSNGSDSSWGVVSFSLSVVSCHWLVVGCKEGTPRAARLLPLLPGLDRRRFWGIHAVDTPGFAMSLRSWRSQR